MVLFSDGFEASDFSAWTSTDGTPTVINTVKHTGTYAMQTESGGAVESCNKTLASAVDTVYTRFYFRFSATPTNIGDRDSIAMIIGEVYVELLNDGGTCKWQVYSAAGGGWPSFKGGTPSVDTWYCLEMKFNKNAADGVQLWVDGVSIGTCASSNAQVQSFKYGVPDMRQSTANHYHDCIVIDSSYIGPESSYSPKTRSGLVSTMTTMLNSKMLFG